MHILETLGIRRAPAQDAPPPLLDALERPTVLLVHDWAGMPEDMAPLAAQLEGHQYRSITLHFDPRAAALGGIERLSELAEEIIEASHRLAPLSAIVAHGLGASAVLLALSRERITAQVVLIGIDTDHQSWSDLSGQLGDVDGLLIHSADDGTTSLHDALEVAAAWPNCMLARVDGLGHTRILSAPSTHASILRFLDIHALPGRAH
jgi:pimeloyl-ACP methyl ester carboxylesterase